MIKQISDIINASPKDGSIYLISKLANDTGFFVSNGKLIYMVKNSEDLGFESMDTEFISLRTHIYIVAVENHPQFESAYYNTLVYKGEQEGTNFVSFIRLCITYCNSTIKCGFIKFFYSLVNLFQLPKEQQFKNLLGLFGELKFIEYVYSNFSCDLSSKWHQGDEYDKYDFVCSDFNFEVKSILSEETIVKIKHEQIFNYDNNYLVAVRIQKDNSGTTLNDLILDIRNRIPFINNYEFQLNLEREKNRVSNHDADTVRFKLVNIQAYKATNLETIKNIPECITGLSYKYDLNGIKSNALTANLFI